MSLAVAFAAKGAVPVRQQTNVKGARPHRGSAERFVRLLVFCPAEKC